MDCFAFYTQDFIENLHERRLRYDYEIVGGGNIAVTLDNGKPVYNAWNLERNKDFKIDKKHLGDYLEIKGRKLYLK